MSELMRLADVTRRVDLSKRSIYYLIKKGDFPRPIRVGSRAVRWLRNEIEDWLLSRPRGAGVQVQ